MAGYRVVYEFDPQDLVDGPIEREGLREIADFIRDEMLQHIGAGNSPVSGGAWKKSLSKDYEKIKSKLSSAKFANMELTGAMLDSLETKIVDGKIQVGWFGGKEAAKANNHNIGDTLPQRQLIPGKGQSFKRDIVQGAKEIAREFLKDGET